MNAVYAKQTPTKIFVLGPHKENLTAHLGVLLSDVSAASANRLCIKTIFCFPGLRKQAALSSK